MGIAQTGRRMRHAFDALAEHRPYIFFDSSSGPPPTGGRLRSDYGSIHQGYAGLVVSRRIQEGANPDEELSRLQREDPEHCIRSARYAVDFSAVYLDCLTKLTETRLVYTIDRVVQEVDGFAEASKHLLASWLVEEADGLHGELKDELIKLFRYQERYATGVRDSVIEYIRKRRQVLRRGDYSYWDEVEEAVEFLKPLSEEQRIRVSDTDIYIVSLAIVNTLKRGTRSKILSRDKGISDLICAFLNEAKAGRTGISDDNTDHVILSQNKSAVAVHHVDLLGNVVTSVNTAQLARGSKRMFEMIERRRRKAQ